MPKEKAVHRGERLAYVFLAATAARLLHRTMDNPATVRASHTDFRVDPFAITDFSRTDSQLEAMFVFCCCVAGKRATMISRMVDDFLGGCGYAGSPFERIRTMVRESTLTDNLRRARIGKYGLLARLFSLATAPGALDLRKAAPADLEAFPGIGPKTARFFILHSRAGAHVAVIDTHMLKYLRAIGVERVPDAIPRGKEYLRLEAVILAEADRLGLSAADFDLQVWSWYASGKQGTTEFSRN